MLFKNTSKRIMSICASGRGFTVFCYIRSLYIEFPLYSSIYFTWPLRKQAAYKQATRGPTASEGLGNEEKVPRPRALLPLPADSNRGPHV